MGEAGFAQLVQGAVVECETRDDRGNPVTVKVALQDIGFGRIYAAVGDAHIASTERARRS
jgi:hypothetical protein